MSGPTGGGDVFAARERHLQALLAAERHLDQAALQGGQADTAILPSTVAVPVAATVTSPCAVILLVPVTELTPPKDGEQVVVRDVRFRTVGDITCTCPVESDAATPEQIVIETLAAEVSERGATRMDDKTSDASMEKRKEDGYF